MKRTIRRLGLTAFLFFLVKGLLWLVIPAGIGLWSLAAAQDELAPESKSQVGETNDSD